MDSKTIELTSGGKIQSFELVMIFEHEAKKYAALAEVEDDENIVIMNLLTENDEYIFETVEDEDQAKSLFVKFISLWETEED